MLTQKELKDILHYDSDGLFEVAEKAYAVYCEAAIKYHGKFARFD